MSRFVLRRALWSLWVVAVVMSLVFALVYAVGDPAVATLGPRAKHEQLQNFRQHHGLDQPLWRQFGGYLGIAPCHRPASPSFEGGGFCGLLQGDLGESFREGEAVSRVIAVRLPRTLLLGAMATFFELCIGLTLGIVAAVWRHSWFDTSMMLLAFAGISTPTFLSGLLFLHFFAFRLGWFPVGGYGFDALAHVQHALLPALTLAITGAATYARIMRSEMIDCLGSDYVRTAHAKGLHPLRVVLVHGARNALLPVVTLLGLQLSVLVSGAIITESIFAWPGIGRLAIESIYNLDAPTILAVVLMASLAVQAGNFLADITVAALDPRLRM
ncbi:MAG: ABC transporter permease [Polyangiales bacterium]